MRSKLFVPGSRPDFFAKALASAADALSFDLEDSVVESRKGEARAAVAELLRTDALARCGKIVIVRVNALGTPHFEADVAAMALPALTYLNVPKTDTAADVRAAVAVLARAEVANGVTRPIGILPNIESPEGLRCAAEVAGADPRVVGLQVGFGDLFEPLGIDRRDTQAVHAIQLAARLAAGEAGVWACDTAFADIQDAEGYRREAEAARRLGYIGKTCLHPTQIAIANDVFRPSDAEIERALRVVAAWRDATAANVGAVLVDGKMIDLPFARRAEATVAIARRLGLIGPP